MPTDASTPDLTAQIRAGCPRNLGADCHCAQAVEDRLHAGLSEEAALADLLLQDELLMLLLAAFLSGELVRRIDELDAHPSETDGDRRAPTDDGSAWPVEAVHV